MNQILSAKTSNSCKVLSDENISKLSTSPKICNNISDSTSTTAASTSAHAAATATPTAAATTSANNISKTSHTNNNYVHPLPTHFQQYHQVTPRKRKFDQPQQPQAGACSSVLVDSLIKTTVTTTSNNNTNSNSAASLSASAKTAPCSTAPSTSVNSLPAPAAKRSNRSIAFVTPPASTLTESTDANGDTLTVVKSERPAADDPPATTGKIADSARCADPTTNPPNNSQHCDSSSGSKAPSNEPQASTASAASPPLSSSSATRENNNHRPLRVSVTLSKVAARKLRQLAANNPRILRKLGIKTLKLASSDGSAGEPIHLPQRLPPSPVPVPFPAQLSALNGGVNSRSGSVNGEYPLHQHHPANGVLVSPLQFAQQQRGASGLSKIITSATPQLSTMEQHHSAAASVAQQHQHMLQQQQQQQFQQHQQRLAAGGGMAPSPMYGAMQTPMSGQSPAMTAGPQQQQQQMQAVMRQNSSIAAQQQRMMAAGGGSNGSVPGTPLSATPIPSQQQQRRSIDTPGTPQQMQLQMNAVQRQNAFQAGAPMGMTPQHGGMMVDQQQPAGQAPHGHHTQPGTSQNMADAPLLVNLLSNNNGPQHHAGMMPGQSPMMTPEQQHAAAMQQRYGGHGPPGMTPGQQQQLYQSQMLQQQQHLLAQQHQGGQGNGGMMSQQQYMQHQQQMILHQQQMQRAAADGAAGAGGMMMMGSGQPGVMPMVPPSQFAPQPGAIPPAANAALQPAQTADNAENPPSKKRKRLSKKQKEEELRLQREQQQQIHQQQLHQKQQQQFAMQQMQQQVGAGNPQDYYIMQHHQQQPRVPAMGMHVVGAPGQMPGQQYQQRMPGYPIQYNGYGGQPPLQGQPPNTPSTPGAMNPMMNPHFPGAYNAPGMHAGHPQAQLWQQQQSAAAAAAAQQHAEFQQQQQMRMTPQHHQPPQVGTPCNFYVHPSSSQSPMDMKSQQQQHIPPPPSYGESNAAAAAVNQRGTPHNIGFMSPSHQHSASPVFSAGGGQQPLSGHGQPSRASTGSIGSNVGTPSTPQQSAAGQLTQQQIFSQLIDYADLGDDLNAITGDADDFDLDSIEPMRTDNSGSNNSPAQQSQQQQQQPNGQSTAQSHQQQHQQMMMQQQMGQQVTFPPEYSGSPAHQQQQQQSQFMHQQQQQHMQMLRQQQQNAMAQQQRQQQLSSQQSAESAGLAQPAPPPQKRQRQGGGTKSGANGGSAAGQQPKSIVKRESTDTAPPNDESGSGGPLVASVKEEEEDLDSKFFAQRSPQNSDEPSSPSKISELQQENITNSIQSVMERVLGNGPGPSGSAAAQPTKGAGSQKGRSKNSGGPKAEKKATNCEGGSGRTGKRPHSIVLPRTASTSDASSLSASPGTAPPSASILSAQPNRSRTPTFTVANVTYSGFNGHANNGGGDNSPTTIDSPTPAAVISEKTAENSLKSAGSKQQIMEAKTGGVGNNKVPSWQRAVAPMESPPANASSSSSAVVTPGSGGVSGSTGTVSIFSSSCSSSSASSMSSTLTDHYANFIGSSETFTTELETTSISSISYKATSKTIAMSSTKLSADASPNHDNGNNGAVDERPAPNDKPAAAERSSPNAAADRSPPSSGGVVKENGGESAEILQASKA